MEVKRLFAVNMKDALARVRDEMGEEAMIVDTRSVPGGVEVTASLELPTTDGGPVADRLRGGPAGANASVNGSDLSASHVRDRLIASGFAPQRLDAWLPLLDSRDWVKSVARHLPVAGRPVAPESGRWALVGPAGSGKTTMVSNLVANHALRYGPDNAALISLDTWRAGGAEQLKVIARLLNVPVFVARDVGDVARMLKVTRSRALVIVDTPGFTMTQVGARHGRAILAPLHELMPLVLTVPATLAVSMQQRLLSEFGELVDGLALTHVDETAALGEVLDTLRQQQKFAWWLGCGPGIPDDLESADAEQLARQLLGLRSSPHVPLANHFAAQSAQEQP